MTIPFIKPKSRLNRQYNHQPDVKDSRDFKFSLPVRDAAALPPSGTVRPNCRTPENQGGYGTCDAFSTKGHFEFVWDKQGLPFISFSALYLYWQIRAIEGTTNYDSGGQIRDAIKAAAASGMCDNKFMPYPATDNGDAAIMTPPSPDAIAAAKSNLALQYESLPQDLNTLKSCIVAGYPFVFGFKVYPQFESDQCLKDGIVQTPSWFQRFFCNLQSLGQHAVMAVGYDDANQWFVVRNSWGDKVQDGGYFYLPYDYITNSALASDFWTIRAVS